MESKGHKNSKHMIGEAIDFYIEGVEIDEVYEYLNNTYKGYLAIGVNYKKGFVHIDTRTMPIRFTY